MHCDKTLYSLSKDAGKELRDSLEIKIYASIHKIIYELVLDDIIPVTNWFG